MVVLCTFTIFNPNAIPHCGTSEFLGYGLNEIAELSTHYFAGKKEAQKWCRQSGGILV